MELMPSLQWGHPSAAVTSRLTSWADWYTCTSSALWGREGYSVAETHNRILFLLTCCLCPSLGMSYVWCSQTPLVLCELMGVPLMIGNSDLCIYPKQALAQH